MMQARWLQCVLVGVLAIQAGACRAQPAPIRPPDGAFAPPVTRSFQEFGAIGDGRADDTAAIGRALLVSERYCLDGGGRTYRVVGTLRAAKSLCLRNATLAQSLVPFDTSKYITGTCPVVDDTQAFTDCGDRAVPQEEMTRLLQSLGVRTLLIRSNDDRPVRINLERVKIDRGRHTDGGSRIDSAGIWLDGADRVDFRDVEITGNGKGFGLFISNARNVTLNNLWIHDLIWSPYRGDARLREAAVASVGWNRVPIREFRERRGGVKIAKFYGVRIQEQVTCAQLQDVRHVRIQNARIERCEARFDTGDLPWQADGLDIGQSSSDIVIDGATIDSTWEGIDVVAGGTGVRDLVINDLDVTNVFSFGLKLGYALRGARIDRPTLVNAGLAGAVVYGPVRDVRITGATIRDVGLISANGRTRSPWPSGNRSGIRIDSGGGGATPEGVLIEDATVSGSPGNYEFGILNTGGRAIQLVRFRAQGFARAQSQGFDTRR